MPRVTDRRSSARTQPDWGNCSCLQAPMRQAAAAALQCSSHASCRLPVPVRAAAPAWMVQRLSACQAALQPFSESCCPRSCAASTVVAPTAPLLAVCATAWTCPGPQQQQQQSQQPQQQQAGLRAQAAVLCPDPASARVLGHTHEKTPTSNTMATCPPQLPHLQVVSTPGLKTALGAALSQPRWQAAAACCGSNQGARVQRTTADAARRRRHLKASGALQRCRLGVFPCLPARGQLQQHCGATTRSTLTSSPA